MLKNTKNFLSMAAAMLGLSFPISGGRRSSLYAGKDKLLARKQWHDPERVKAASERRVLREQRNLANAERGAFGPDWQAL